MERTRKSTRKYKASFLDSLYAMLECGIYQGIVCWSRDGSFFKIIDPPTFSSSVLPHYYKHEKLSSFIRQLHLYGFKKTYQECEISNIAYIHPLFQQGRRDLLEKIKRNKNVGEETTVIPKEPSERTEDREEDKEITKRKKLTKNSGIKSSDNSNISGNEFLYNFENELTQMKNKIHWFMTVYFPNLNPQENEAEAPIGEENLWQEYQNFCAGLQKVLGFEEIEKSYN